MPQCQRVSWTRIDHALENARGRSVRYRSTQCAVVAAPIEQTQGTELTSSSATKPQECAVPEEDVAATLPTTSSAHALPITVGKWGLRDLEGVGYSGTRAERVPASTRVGRLKPTYPHINTDDS